MAMYGKIGDTPTNNFATRPGVFPGSGPKPTSDYLFGANMGLPEEENNLAISKARIKSVLPYPLNFGQLTKEDYAGGLIITAGTVMLAAASADGRPGRPDFDWDTSQGGEAGRGIIAVLGALSAVYGVYLLTPSWDAASHTFVGAVGLGLAMAAVAEGP